VVLLIPSAIALPEPNPVFVVGLPALLAAAAICDLRWRRVPNALTAVMALSGLLVRWADAGPSAVLGGISLGLAVFGVGFVLQLLRLLGGGDVKLFAALAVWIGSSGMLTAVAGTAIAGGLLGLVYLKRSGARGIVRSVRPTSRIADAPLLSRLQLPDGDDSARVPYAFAIAAGGLWAWAVQLRLLNGVL
jgi:prepilin peptidase CpaA